MIYDYYCVECGRKFSGEEINFDLAEFLGLRGSGKNNVIESRITQIGTDRIKELASHSGTKFEHRKRCKINITLKELLEIMGENAGGQALRDEMGSYAYSELPNAVSRVFNNAGNAEVVGQLIQSYLAALRNKFVSALDEDSTPEAERTDNYKASFWLEPEFFEAGKSDKLYTFKYSDEEDPVNMQELLAPTMIRGYCPKCGKPIVVGAGQYQHILIGLLGAQSAGKTSAIVAMLSEMRSLCTALNLYYPGNALCDGRYQDREINIRLYERGWAVRKTSVETSAGTFNASLLLRSEKGGRAQIITFIDIAGEQCFNSRTRTINKTAFQVYPLINSCDVYLLCTCIDKTGYGNADGEDTIIDPDAVLLIARGIYENLADPKKIPPLCIVATKADMAADSAAGMANGNPFEAIRKDPQIKLKNIYSYMQQLDQLEKIYNTVEDEKVREPLRWCCMTFRDLMTKTYISMLSCSSLGRKGAKYDGDISDIDQIEQYRDEAGKEKPFTRQRMDVLWKWILQVTGLLALDGSKYIVPYVPARGEGYINSDYQNTDSSKRMVYSVEESLNRSDAVMRLFMNPTTQDVALHDILIEDLGFWEKIRGITKKSKAEQFLQQR